MRRTSQTAELLELLVVPDLDILDGKAAVRGGLCDIGRRQPRVGPFWVSMQRIIRFAARKLIVLYPVTLCCIWSVISCSGGMPRMLKTFGVEFMWEAIRHHRGFQQLKVTASILANDSPLISSLPRTPPNAQRTPPNTLQRAAGQHIWNLPEHGNRASAVEYDSIG